MAFSSRALTVLLASGIAASAAPSRHVARQADSTPTPYSPKTAPLDTPWTSQVGTNPWPEYPRPQLERSEWQNLNGVWQYESASNLSAVNSPPFNQALSESVLIPSCLESGLSGIQTANNLYSWFSTSFTVPANWTNELILLNFGAVDYEATVFVNGDNVTFHTGGYSSFTVDITNSLYTDGPNELLVFVHDPTDSGDYVIPIGKQTLRPSHIFYTPCSGIWQSVWIESAPAEYITDLQLSAGADGTVNTTVYTSGNDLTPVSITIYERNSRAVVATSNGTANSVLSFKVDLPDLWSPNSPTLYDVKVSTADGSDTVKSYTGFRTITSGTVDGVLRPIVNGEPTFIFATLDQGYWPDGIYTPPNKEAMVFDLQTLKTLGFNAVRKHIKVENALFYQACDELGLFVHQDFPSLRPLQWKKLPDGSSVPFLPDTDQQAEFQRQMGDMVKQLRSIPSLIIWTIYNEGWGQLLTPDHPEFGLVDFVRSLDPTRLIDATSGWWDHGAGDFSDNHHYAEPQCGTPFYSMNASPFNPTRIAYQGEFGGLGSNLTLDHMWNVQAAIDTIGSTYEIEETLEGWNYRAHVLIDELRQQTERYSCSGGVWTQTTDVEGEPNGLLSYDRRILRPDVAQWQSDIQALYDTLASRTNAATPGS